MPTGDPIERDELMQSQESILRSAERQRLHDELMKRNEAIARGEMGGPVMIPRAVEAVPRKVSVALEVMKLTERAIDPNGDLARVATNVLLDYLKDG